VRLSGCVCVGLTLAEKWNTDCNLGTEISVEDQLVNGLKLSFDALFAPQTGSVVLDHTVHSVSRACVRVSHDVVLCRPRSRGDGTFGSVHVCVRPFVCGRSPV